MGCSFDGGLSSGQWGTVVRGQRLVSGSLCVQEEGTGSGLGGGDGVESLMGACLAGGSGDGLGEGSEAPPP